MNRKYRKTVIAGNWKMNMLPSEVKAYTDSLRERLPKHKTCEIVLCVPFTHVYPLKKALKDAAVQTIPPPPEATAGRSLATLAR